MEKTESFFKFFQNPVMYDDDDDDDEDEEEEEVEEEERRAGGVEDQSKKRPARRKRSEIPRENSEVGVRVNKRGRVIKKNVTLQDQDYS